MTVSPDHEIGPSRTEVPSPTSPTRGMEILRTPGVTRDQEYAERGTYTKNIVALDTRLLQDEMKLILKDKDQLQLMVINPGYSP